MTTYVTREEYDRLAERLAAIEAGQVSVSVDVDGSRECVSRLVEESVRSGLAAYKVSFERSQARRR